MDLHLPLHHWEGRQPNVGAAAVAGFAAGAVLMVIELAWAAFAGGDATWRTAQLVAALMLGPTDTLYGSPDVFDPGIVGVALLTHYLLGTGFGLLLGAVVAGYRIDERPGAVLVVGALLGLLLYAINFYAFTNAFPWFAELRGWRTLGAHLVFGASAGLMYVKLAALRRGEAPGT